MHFCWVCAILLLHWLTSKWWRVSDGCVSLLHTAHPRDDGSWAEDRYCILQYLTTTGTLTLIKFCAKFGPLFCPLLLQGTKNRKWSQRLTCWEETHTHFALVSWRVKDQICGRLSRRMSSLCRSEESHVSVEETLSKLSCWVIDASTEEEWMHRPECNYKNEKHVKTHYSAQANTDGTCSTHRQVKQNCCSAHVHTYTRTQTNSTCWRSDKA